MTERQDREIRTCLSYFFFEKSSFTLWSDASRTQDNDFFLVFDLKK